MRILVTGSMLALAACSGGGGDGSGNGAAAPGVPAREAHAQAAIEAAVAQNGIATTATTGVPVGEGTPAAARRHNFPTEFLGYWGATPDDCELANTAATGRVNIDADTIRFHETRARVQRIVPSGPYALSAELRFGDDGGMHEESYVLENGGTRLVRTVPSDGAQRPATTRRYAKC